MRQNKSVEKLFFNRFRNGYEVFHCGTYKKFLNFFVNLVRPNNKLKCLELGCGSGAFTKYLAKLNLDLIAVDISEECINFAKQQIHNVKFVVADIENLNFDDETFDIVVAGAVIHHFAFDFSKVINEIYRVLKQGGSFFAYEPNKRNPVMWLYRDPHSPFYSSKGVTPNERPITKTEIMKELLRAGFTNNNIFAISGITYKYVESKIARFFLPVYNLFEKLFEKIPLISNQFGSFLIIFSKKG